MILKYKSPIIEKYLFDNTLEFNTLKEFIPNNPSVVNGSSKNNFVYVVLKNIKIAPRGTNYIIKKYDEENDGLLFDVFDKFGSIETNWLIENQKIPRMSVLTYENNMRNENIDKILLNYDMDLDKSSISEIQCKNKKYIILFNKIMNIK